MISSGGDGPIEELLTAPFPEEVARVRGLESGPGYHLLIVRESRDFWDDRDEETVEAAEAEIDAALRELRAGLIRRWGAPETVGLGRYLSAGTPVPEPLLQLSMLAGELALWRAPVPGRWLALAVGQADPEFPVQLLAAVGATPFPEPGPPGPGRKIF